MSNRPVLLFMHIPKTAGTSLRIKLAQVMRPAERAFLYARNALPGAITPEQLAAMPELQQRRLRLVFGHFHFGLHEQLRQPARYVTMLREPVARVISLFGEYSRTQPDMIGGGLDEWLRSGLSLQLDNEMVRTIAGRRRVPFGKCDQSLFDEAIEHAEESFASILLVEEMERSLAVLGQLLNRPLDVVGRDNAAPGELAVSASLQQAIAEMNRWDIQLYEYGVRRLAEFHVHDWQPIVALGTGFGIVRMACSQCDAVA